MAISFYLHCSLFAVGSGHWFGAARTGATIGERGVLLNEPRSATVVADCDNTQLLRVSKEQFDAILRPQTKLVHKIRTVIRHSMTVQVSFSELARGECARDPRTKI